MPDVFDVCGASALVIPPDGVLFEGEVLMCGEGCVLVESSMIVLLPVSLPAIR